jgi:hypothetical protein
MALVVRRHCSRGQYFYNTEGERKLVVSMSSKLRGLGIKSWQLFFPRI